MLSMSEPLIPDKSQILHLASSALNLAENEIRTYKHSLPLIRFEFRSPYSCEGGSNTVLLCAYCTTTT